jgi:hypothetical protein
MLSLLKGTVYYNVQNEILNGSETEISVGTPILEISSLWIRGKEFWNLFLILVLESVFGLIGNNYVLINSLNALLENWLNCPGDQKLVW